MKGNPLCRCPECQFFGWKKLFFRAYRNKFSVHECVIFKLFAITPISVQPFTVKTTAVLLQNALLSPNFGKIFCYNTSVSRYTFTNSHCQNYNYRGSPSSTVSTSTISTSMNFQKVLDKVVLVGDLISKFALVELTLYMYYSTSTKFA